MERVPGLPIQVQIEPPRRSALDRPPRTRRAPTAIGIHIESLDHEVRAAGCPARRPSRRRATTPPGDGRSALRPQPGLDLPAGRSRRGPGRAGRRGDPPDRHGRLPVRRPLSPAAGHARARGRRAGAGSGRAHGRHAPRRRRRCGPPGCAARTRARVVPPAAPAGAADGGRLGGGRRVPGGRGARVTTSRDRRRHRRTPAASRRLPAPAPAGVRRGAGAVRRPRPRRVRRRRRDAGARRRRRRRRRASAASGCTPSPTTPTWPGGAGAAWCARTRRVRRGDVGGALVRAACATAQSRRARCASTRTCRSATAAFFERLGWEHAGAVRSRARPHLLDALADRALRTRSRRRRRRRSARLLAGLLPADRRPRRRRRSRSPARTVAACDAILPRWSSRRPGVGRLVRDARQRQRPRGDGRGPRRRCSTPSAPATPRTPRGCSRGSARAAEASTCRSSAATPSSAWGRR